jgi:hypothetical protein
MTDELPPLWALDMASSCAGAGNWQYVFDSFHGDHVMRHSVIAHARTLADNPEKYKPVDPYELKRRHDAREAACAFWAKHVCISTGEESRTGKRDADGPVYAPYIALCNRDGTQPIPVEEWSK